MGCNNATTSLHTKQISSALCESAHYQPLIVSEKDESSFITCALLDKIDVDFLHFSSFLWKEELVLIFPGKKGSNDTRKASGISCCVAVQLWTRHALIICIFFFFYVTF